MKSLEFFEKLKKGELDLKKFSVFSYNQENDKYDILIGRVGIIETNIVYIDFNEIPFDLLYGNYMYYDYVKEEIIETSVTENIEDNEIV